MTSFLVDLTEPATVKKPLKKIVMSVEELNHLLSEVEKKQNCDPRAAQNLLKLIASSS